MFLIKKLKKKNYFDMWQVTCDRSHMTRDTWHMTHNTECGMNIFPKCQLPSSSGLGLTLFGRFKKKKMSHWKQAKIFLMCRPPYWNRLWSHQEQAKGFYPVWVILCVFWCLDYKSVFTQKDGKGIIYCMLSLLSP